MSATPHPTENDLRAWFDRLVDLSRDAQRRELESAPLAEPSRVLLREMLLFGEFAGGCPGSEGAREVDDLPGGRARIDALLSRDRALQAVRDEGAKALLETLRRDVSHAEDESLVGTTIGPFRLTSVIGQGGSAAVFRAVRNAGDGSQTVALKLLRTGLHSAESQRRFRREQAFLAQLNHPNIATLIEAGVSEAAIPYIAMEFVDGEPITDAARSRALDVRERLEWFATLCRTIEAAHQALIVHRDLKPSNILVARDGALKVLDFGIARALADSDVTHTQSIALTPAYAAPEQYQGGRLTTAVDVYALGVILGELLTGQRFGGSERASKVAEECADLPDGLPARASLVRQLRGDLDAILRSALAHDPAMRYRSAAALGDDIERHLAGKPVRAHPASAWYRARKFVARHATIVIGTTLFVLALIAALAFALWQADVARHEARRANTVRDFVEHIFEPIRDRVAKDKQPALQDLLAVGLDRINTDRTLSDTERVDLLTMFSHLEGSVGNAARARELADASLALARRSLPPTHPLPIAALASRGYASAQLEDYASASTDLREAHRLMAETGLRGAPLIELLGPLAHIEHIAGHDEASLALAREDLAERIATYGPDDAEVGDGYNNVADALEASERYDESIAMWKRTHEFQLAHVGGDSDKVALSLAGLGSVQYRAGHWNDAHRALEQAVALYERIGNPAQLDHVWAAQKLCQLDGWLARPSAQRDSCARASALSELRFGEASALNAESISVDAGGWIENGDLDRAEVETRRALATFENVPANGPRIGNAASNLALIDMLHGDVEAARKRLPDAIRLIRSVPQYQLPPLLAESRLLLACSEAAGEECASDLEARVEHDALAVPAQDNPRLLWVHTILARVEIGQERAGEALRRLAGATEKAGRELPAVHPRMIEATLWSAVAAAETGDCGEARRYAESAGAAARDGGTLGHPFYKAARHRLRETKRCGVLESW
jgi:serine/threonine-protein kinase